MRWFIILIIMTVVGVLGGTWLRESWPQPQPQPTHTRSLQHGTQPRDDVATPRAMTLMPEPNRRMGGVRPTACQVEDSDASGQWCVWTNGRTGKSYYVNPLTHVN